MSRGFAAQALAPPEPPIVVEYRDELIFLLREAAELEHAIMCAYLFAAFTMKQRTDEGLTPPQLAAVDRWRSVVFAVAKQEMLHLAIVQNLLTAVGAAPYLARPDLPAPARHFPPGVQIPLIAFGERALRHFLFLERPEGMALDDPEAAAAIAHAEPVIDRDDIVPQPQSFATVGHLYRAIEAGMARLASHMGEGGLFLGPPEAQATAAAFGWPELIPVTDLASAHQAIETVIEQGEGVTGDWRRAHFGRFYDLLADLLARRREDPAFEPARSVVVGRVRPGEDGADASLISDRTTARVADLFNVLNEVLLLALSRFFARTEETPPQLVVLSDVAVGLMFRAIKPLGELLTQLPFGPSHPGRTAAPTFELFYRSGYLLPHRSAAWRILAERLRQAADLARRIDGSPGNTLEYVAGVLDNYAAQLAT